MKNITNTILVTLLYASIGFCASAAQLKKQYPLLSKIGYVGTTKPLEEFDKTNDDLYVRILVGMIERDYANNKKEFEARAQELEQLMEANKAHISAETWVHVQEELSSVRRKWHTSSSASKEE